jgi:transcriptional regulator with XRE-family HTH domain
MGVSAATVRRYETGARRMSPKRFAAAVVFFGLPMSWFFSEDGAPGNTPRR